MTAVELIIAEIAKQVAQGHPLDAEDLELYLKWGKRAEATQTQMAITFGLNLESGRIDFDSERYSNYAQQFFAEKLK